MGHRATNTLIQDSLRDAWFLGVKVPFSQSLKEFKSNSNNIWVKELIVDELRGYNKGASQLKNNN